MLYWLLFNKTSSCITSSSTCYHEWLWLVISIECWCCLFQNEDFYHGKEIARSWCCRNLKFFVMMNWSLIGKWDPHLGFVMYKLMWSFKTAQTQFERPLLWPYFHLSWHWQRASSVAGEWLVFKFFKYIEVLHESNNHHIVITSLDWWGSTSLKIQWSINILVRTEFTNSSFTQLSKFYQNYFAHWSVNLVQKVLSKAQVFIEHTDKKTKWKRLWNKIGLQHWNTYSQYLPLSESIQIGLLSDGYGLFK